MPSPAQHVFRTIETHHDKIYLRLKRRQQAETHELQLWILNSLGEPVQASGMGLIEPDLVTFQTEAEDGTGEFIMMSAAHCNVTFKVVKSQGKPRKVGFSLNDGVPDEGEKAMSPVGLDPLP